MRDSLVFYSSFYEAIEVLDDGDQLKAYKAIMNYALNGIEPSSDIGISYAIFLAVKPQIDANNQRYENSTKGGRPTKKPMVSKKEENSKPMVSKKEENEKPMVLENEENSKPMVSKNEQIQKPNVNENVNVNVNDNVNVKEKINKKETFVSIVDDYTLNDELKSCLMSFIDMRRKMKGYTIEALKLNLNTLNKLARDDITKIEIVKQSIANSWKSFYELKNKTKHEEVLPTYASNNNLQVSDDDIAKYLGG